MYDFLKKWPLIIVLICVIIPLLYKVGFRINVTGSMSKGLYFLQFPNGLNRDAFVTVKLPKEQLLLGIQRQYIESEDTVLLKRLIALPGDNVIVCGSQIIVNGIFTYQAPRFTRDKHNREMNLVKDGIYLCGKNDYWVLGMDDLSWDSRYFGPVEIENISNSVRQILAF